MAKKEYKEKGLEEREKRLEEREEVLAESAKALDEGAKALDAREETLDQKEAFLQAMEGDRPFSVMEEEAAPEVLEIDKKLIAQGCEAYGIDDEHLLKARIEVGDAGARTAVLITHGGAKVRYVRDQEVEPLKPVRVHGNPPAKKRKGLTAGKVNGPRA